MRLRGGAGRAEAGFTLIELLVVIVIAGVVGGIVVRGITSAFRANAQLQDRVEAISELQVATERVGRELRVACPIASMDTDDIAVEILRDTDGDLLPERLRHRYWAASDELHQSIELHDSATSTWSFQVTDRVLLSGAGVPGVDTFTYLDDAGAVLDPGAALPSQVHNIQLTLARDLTDQGPIEVETLLHLRNGGAACDGT